ncbi:MAG: DMT family transporter [Chloroflexi bacterium]|nr:DMT family transporter [Chloroflexota bacterium]
MPRSTQERILSGFFWMGIAVLGYSVFPIFARGIYAEAALRPSDVAAWRFLLATPTLWLIVAFTQARRSPAVRTQNDARQPGRGPLMAMGALHGCASLPAFFALEHVAAGLYSILFYSYPTMVALLSLFLGERLPRAFWWALLGTTGGVLLALAPGLEVGAPGAELGQGVAFGGLLALLNAFLVACYFQFSRRILRDTPDVLRAVAWSFLGSLSVLATLALALGLRLPGGRDFALLLGLAWFSTVVALVARNYGIQRLGPPRAALVATAEPLVTLVLAAVLLAEFLVPTQLLGGALILGSVALLARDRQAASTVK